MENSENISKKEEYNNIPVHYCKHCLSLRIRTLDDDTTDYCDECGSTDIEVTDIETWKKMYNNKYSKK